MISKMHYLKEAVTEPLNIWAMVGFAAAAAFTAASQGESWLPLAAGVSAEVAYLALVPTSNFYRRLVERREAHRNLELRRREREERIKSFDPREREAVEYLRWMKSKIYDNYKKFTGLKEIPPSINCLDSMWESFVDFLDMYRRRKYHLRSVNRQSILNQIMQTQRDMARADGPTRMLMEKNLELLNRRLATFDDIERSVRHVEEQLKSIENFFSLVNDQVVTMNTMESITTLDSTFETLLANIETTKQILEETNPIMTSLNTIENINNSPARPQPQMRVHQ